jgi:UMF1 family MFS transporter
LTFARIARWKNNVLSMKIMLLIWIVICVMAYSVTSKAMFYMVAALVGLVIGGIQSVSRSTFSKLIPHGHEDVTCFFSFYNVVYYVSIVLGSFMFGFVDQITGSMRYSVLSLILFFCLAFVLISQVKKEHLAQ